MTTGVYPRPTVSERFWKKVNKTETCWLWRGETNGKGGYGLVYTGEGKPSFLAHRYAYEQVIGPIQDGLHLDHLCRVRRCVNPAHLEPVTNKENILRGISSPAMNAKKTHCQKGHEYDRTYKNGSRGCHTCRMALQKINRSKKRMWQESLKK